MHRQPVVATRDNVLDAPGKLKRASPVQVTQYLKCDVKGRKAVPWHLNELYELDLAD